MICICGLICVLINLCIWGKKCTVCVCVCVCVCVHACVCVHVCAHTSVLGDVPHPGQGLVAALLDDLEVANLWGERERAQQPSINMCVKHISLYFYREVYATFAETGTTYWPVMSLLGSTHRAPLINETIRCWYSKVLTSSEWQIWGGEFILGVYGGAACWKREGTTWIIVKPIIFHNPSVLLYNMIKIIISHLGRKETGHKQMWKGRKWDFCKKRSFSQIKNLFVTGTSSSYTKDNKRRHG